MLFRRLIHTICLNLRPLLYTTAKICGVFFAVVTTIIAFIPLDTISEVSVCKRILCVLFVAVIAFICASLYLIIKRTNCIWSCGSGRLSIIYGDIFEIGFTNKQRENRIVVIPVNTHFDTIVDEEIGNVDKPLVSPNTLHGQWLKRMLKSLSQSQINQAIQNSLEKQGLKANIDDKRIRGNTKKYEIGSIAKVQGNYGVAFFLLALSRFDENNNAQCDEDSFVEALRKLVSFYNTNGQGYSIYIPLMGTNLSRAGLSHDDALQKIISLLMLDRYKIHGEVTIVIYNKDRDKVSIWHK